MSSAIQLLKQAVQANRATPNQEYRWEDLRAAMLTIIAAPPSEEAERLLLSVLQFDGSIRLDASGDAPHSMPPEDMLKSLALQALAKWTGPIYVREMQRLQALTTSPALASVVRDVLQRIGRVRKQTEDLEAVAESSPEKPSMIRILLIGQERGMAFLPDRRVRQRKLQPAK